jgi:site-specific DNA-methyltransferase (adenine-specific)
MCHREKLAIGKRNKNDIATPHDLLFELWQEFHFNFDPCPLNADFDGLSVPWKERNFVNPPFDNVAKFLEKGLKELEKGKLSVFLITAKTFNEYWHKYIWPRASEIRFFRGKLQFEGFDNYFPVPCCLVIYDPARYRNEPVEERKKFSTFKINFFE